MDVRSRHHLRSDEVRRLTETVREALGVELDAESYELVELEDGPVDVVLLDGAVHACYHEDRPFLTVRGANAYPPTRRVVTVDAGAVSFVGDGADVMRPGVVEADETIGAGDLVVVAEETHGKVLAVGEALVEGAEMRGEQGRVVESLHHVGDDLYELTV